jgi:capsular polysaccharide biosynthesis protein
MDSKRYTPLVSTASEPGISADAAQGDYTFSLEEPLRIIWRRLWVILLVAIVLAGAAASFSLLQTPMYEAYAKILVRQEQSGGGGGNLQGLQQITQTMVEGIRSRPIAEAAIEEHNLGMSPGEILGRLNVKQVGSTPFIQVNYRDPNPEKAQLVANSIGEVFSERTSEVTNTNAITATLWERAQVPGQPVSTNLVQNIAVALVVGLLLGVGLAFLLEYLDNSWRSPEEAEQISGVPTFGVIPEFKALTGKKKGG